MSCKNVHRLRKQHVPQTLTRCYGGTREKYKNNFFSLFLMSTCDLFRSLLSLFYSQWTQLMCHVRLVCFDAEKALVYRRCGSAIIKKIVRLAKMNFSRVVSILSHFPCVRFWLLAAKCFAHHSVGAHCPLLSRIIVIDVRQALAQIFCWIFFFHFISTRSTTLFLRQAIRCDTRCRCLARGTSRVHI